MTEKNISPEIEAAIEEGRRQGLREAAEYVAGLREERVPYIFWDLGSAFHGQQTPDGWAPLSENYKERLAGVSRGILRLINHEPVPDCPHPGWSSCEDPVCCVCGKTKSALAA